jgi:ATP-dependent helicase/nuclease subunit A
VKKEKVRNMGDTRWTDEQKDAITDRGCNLLVAAGAGAGKTAVLVQRIIEKIMDEEHPVDIDKLLVVTFTNAAAAEMRERIGDAITRELDKNPGSTRLQSQLTLLGRANIMTIHSFCLGVIKSNFHLLDMEPNFRICDETESVLLKQEVMDELFEDKFDEGDEAFINLVKALGDSDDKVIQDLVQNLYRFAVSTPWPDRWLEERAALFNVEDDFDFGCSDWAGILMEDIGRELEGCLGRMEKSVALIESSGELTPYIDIFRSDTETARQLMEIDSWNKLGEELNKLQFAKLPALRKLSEEAAAKKDMAKDARDYFKKKTDALRKELFDNAPAAGKSMGSMYPLLKALSDTTIDFSSRFGQKKRERGLIDFNDIEHFALDILSEDGMPSKSAVEYRNRFEEILIDEYQDSNQVQEEIMTKICREDMGNVFMVGDVKQSIYRFRHAKPELFLQKYKSYGNEIGEPGKKIKLYKNFRSRREIIDGVNYIFKQIMSRDMGELEYDDSEALLCGADYCEKQNCIEINIMDKAGDCPEELEELDNIQTEARFVAKRIRGMLDEGFMVHDRSTGDERKMTFRDIVILMRATEGSARVYLDELSSHGIPAFADTATGYFETIEIKTIMSLLQIIDNPLQDIPMIAVLRSPIFSFSPEELIDLRAANREVSFYEILISMEEDESPLKEKVKSFLIKLEEWRDKATYLKIDEFIWFLYSDTAYYSLSATMPQGEQRQANLRLLFQRAKEFESTSYKGLFNFINFVEKLKNSSGDMGSAKILGENQNVVRIMSIHKSKGLEFPVVFLCGTGRNFNMMDLNRNILFHQELGFGPDFVDFERRLSYPTLPKQVIRRKLKAETLSEEMRILYVAFTRAKEKLVITGMVRDIGKTCERWCESAAYTGGKIPEHCVAGSKCYLDWIGTAVAKCGDGERIRIEAGAAADFIDVTDDCSKWEVRIIDKAMLVMDQKEQPEVKDFNRLIEEVGDDSCNSGIGLEVEKRLQWKYRYAEAARIPTKISVSELKKSVGSKQTALKKPNFLAGEKRMTAAMKGTLLHLAMQHMDMEKVSTLEDIRSQIKGLVELEFIAEDEAAAINPYKILKFFQSEVGRRMCASVNSRREVPFFIELAAVEVYQELPKDVYGSETIVLQGVIDCFFEEDGELVLLDYKTDFVEDESAVVENYRVQIELYAMALEKVTGKKVKERFLYLFNTDKAVVLNA